MNELSVKQATLIENPASTSGGADKASAPSGLTNAFQKLVSKASVNFAATSGSVQDRSAILAGIGALNVNTVDDRPYSDIDRPERNDDNLGDIDRPVNERVDNPQDNRIENRADNQTDNNQSSLKVSETPANNEQGEQNNRGQENTQNNNENSSAGQDSGNDNDNTGNSSAVNEQNNGENQATTKPTDGQQAINASNNPAAQLLAATEIVSAAKSIGKAQQQTGPAAKTGGQENIDTTKGLDVKTEKAVKPTQVANANAAEKGTNNQNTEKAANPAQFIQQQGLDKTSLDTVKTSTVVQQSQALSQKLGNGERLQVNVEVSKESEKLVSRPANLLNSAAAATAEAKSKATANGQPNGNAQNVNLQQTANVAATQNQSNQQGVTQSAAARFQAITGTGAVASNGASTVAITEGGAQNANTAASAPSSNALQNAQSTSQQSPTQTQNRAPLPGHNVVDQVNVKISKALQAGVDKIKIQLRPAELGRVEVKLELTGDGRAQAVVTADNKDTLELLRRDASELQRALSDAGLNLDQNDLEFNLKGQEHQTADNNGNGTSNGPDGLADADGDAETDSVQTETNIIEDDRVDVRA